MQRAQPQSANFIGCVSRIFSFSGHRLSAIAGISRVMDVHIGFWPFEYNFWKCYEFVAVAILIPWDFLSWFDVFPHLERTNYTGIACALSYQARLGFFPHRFCFESSRIFLLYLWNFLTLVVLLLTSQIHSHFLQLCSHLLSYPPTTVVLVLTRATVMQFVKETFWFNFFGRVVSLLMAMLMMAMCAIALRTPCSGLRRRANLFLCRSLWPRMSISFICSRMFGDFWG